MAKGKYIAYYRVSTDKQGRSGLGLEAQRKSVADYLNGGSWKLAKEFTEVESGKRNNRPELIAALAACKRHKATLVIAKLDRLARNTKFLLGIVDSGVDVVFCDLPEIPTGAIGRFMITQMAAVAELEGGLISERTKAALVEAKARGVKLGNPDPVSRNAALNKGRRYSIDRANQFAANVLPVVRELQASGVSTLQRIADALNARGIQTQRGGSWHPTTVSNLLKREAAAA
jgi:DNA invertase Pin-like site-specific DNA recombinase